MRIVIADDAGFMRQILRQVIEAAGHEIVGEATNGREAVDLYESLRPDLVFMDITMPELDGIEAVGVIKRMNHQAKVVMCSAMTQDWMVMDAIRAGAYQFIAKPFKPEMVYEVLEKIERSISDSE